jgi:hypothetical protein
MAASDRQRLFDQARLLVRRLERLSADSIWAHRASGIRASLDKALASEQEIDFETLNSLIVQGFDILHKAAQELTPPEIMD